MSRHRTRASCIDPPNPSSGKPSRVGAGPTSAMRPVACAGAVLWKRSLQKLLQEIDPYHFGRRRRDGRLSAEGCGTGRKLTRSHMIFRGRKKDAARTLIDTGTASWVRSLPDDLRKSMLRGYCPRSYGRIRKVPVEMDIFNRLHGQRKAPWRREAEEPPPDGPPSSNAQGSGNESAKQERPRRVRRPF